MIELIPAIDIIDGKCVRLSQGDYDSKKVYNENPVEVAKELAWYPTPSCGRPRRSRFPPCGKLPHAGADSFPYFFGYRFRWRGEER